MKTLKQVLEYLEEKEAATDLMQAVQAAISPDKKTAAKLAACHQAVATLALCIDAEDIDGARDATERLSELLDEVEASCDGRAAVALSRLLDCCELNLDDLEPDTLEALEQARDALEGSGVPAGKDGIPDDANECCNCGHIWDDGEMKEINDYFSRVEPGGVVPSGQCPDCGSLCFPKEGA